MTLGVRNAGDEDTLTECMSVRMCLKESDRI